MCIKTAPFLTNLSGCVKDMASVGPEMSCHHGKSKKQARGHLALVETMKEKIYEKFVNPFRSTNKADLLIIVTGITKNDLILNSTPENRL